MTKKRRGRGEGTMYQRPDGWWQGQLSLGTDADGKRLRKTLADKTKAGLQKKMQAEASKAATSRKNFGI